MVSGGGRITFGGLASGIDTNSIIDQLITIQRRPILLAQNRLAQVNQKADAFAKVGTALSALLTRAEALNQADTYRQRSTSVMAKEADANKIAAVASVGAVVGSFSIQVTQLATQTTAASAAPVGQAVDAGAPLDQAGLGGGFTPGTFSINGTQFTIAAATATSVVGAASVGASFDASATLENGGLDVTPVAGSFEINGVTINYNPATDRMADVTGYINNSAAGVKASFDSNSKQFTLTHSTPGSGQAITLQDHDGNFLKAMKLLDGGGAAIGTVSAGTDLVSLNDVIDQINNAGIGVTVTLENDAAGRPNLLQVASGATVQLGSGGDTSNFLSVTRLLESPPGTTRTSQRGLGAVSRTDNLADARLATALAQASGTFRINGVEISYDASIDSLSNIVTRVNNSDAGVTLTYDAFTDTMRLTNDDSGALAIGLEDANGNLLSALGLIGATQTMGQNAAYSIDGGATRYSTTNTITDAVDGVTLTVTDETTDVVRINVNQHAQGAVSAADSFVTEFNKAMDVMAGLRVYREDGKSGVLLGDGTLRRIEQGLRSVVTRSVPGLGGGLRTLADIGISFGAVGSAVGETKHLVFDNAKFTAAMQSNPEGVAQLMTIFTADASLTGGGTGSIASISGSPTAATKTGRYTVDSDADGNLMATFHPDDGSAATTKNGTIAAGGTNSTLIPGVTLTAAGTLVAGTNQIVIGAPQHGLAKSLNEFIDSLTRSGGLLASRDEETKSLISDINDQIDRLEARVSAREEQLVKKFTAMELTISQLQSQQQALTQMQTQLQAMSARK